MFSKIIFTGALIVGASNGFSESLKLWRPEAYTRGIGVVINASDISGGATPTTSFKLKPGRPEEYTRGIGGGVFNNSAQPMENAPSNPTPMAKPGRPDAYTRGIHPNSASMSSKLMDQTREKEQTNIEAKNQIACEPPALPPSTSFSKLMDQVRSRDLEKEKSKPKGSIAKWGPLPLRNYSKLLDQQHPVIEMKSPILLTECNPGQ